MVVVDCSVVVDALTGLAGTEAVRAVLIRDELNAPELLDIEVVSALRGLTLKGALSESRAEDALTDYDDLPIRRRPTNHDLRRRAFQLRGGLSAHDAAYVVLAEVLDCRLVTRDRRLSRSRGHGVDIEVL